MARASLKSARHGGPFSESPAAVVEKFVRTRGRFDLRGWTPSRKFSRTTTTCNASSGVKRVSTAAASSSGHRVKEVAATAIAGVPWSVERDDFEKVHVLTHPDGHSLCQRGAVLDGPHDSIIAMGVGTESLASLKLVFGKLCRRCSRNIDSVKKKALLTAIGAQEDVRAWVGTR